MTSDASAPSQVFLDRVILKNYKSIAACDVKLGALTFLVGLNGSGKSNFVDALRFVADALRTQLEYAVRDRGGVQEVRRRSSGHPTHFGMKLCFQLPEGSGHYSFRIGARKGGAFELQQEECLIGTSFFTVTGGRVRTNATKVPPAAPDDRLYLVNASGLDPFRPVYDAFTRMGFYSINPDEIRKLQASNPGELLARDGSNIAAILSRLREHAPATKRRIEEYLSKVVPGISAVDSRTLGPLETVEFRQDVAGAKDKWRFLAAAMSDGTLRALGVLVGILQTGEGGRVRPSIVSVEEPEVALHPAAAAVLRESLKDASRTTQLLVTSHSPDLLDDTSLSADHFLAVLAHEGVTQIGPIDQAGRSALTQNLYTPGELLKMDQLTPDVEALRRARIPSLFERTDV
jgi:predicted ATPase